MKTNPMDLSILLYGIPKIGKSTWASGAPDALFMATEAGLNHLEVFQAPIQSWTDFLNACAALAQNEHKFKTIVIDTIDNLYKMCSTYVCEKKKIEHESDLGYGKGFAATNNEFQTKLTKLSLLPYGLIMISHSKNVEIETRTAKKIHTIPTLPTKAREIVLGLSDMILFASIKPEQHENKMIERRVIFTKPSDKYEAGDRTNRLPAVLDLNFQKFLQAYQNGGKAADPIAQKGAMTNGNKSK
jgi:hypothetical protein